MKTDAIVLAAGLSTRMGRNKLLLPYLGRPILQHTIDLVSSLPFHSRILVSREETIGGVTVPDDFIVLRNPRPQEGQSASMRIGLECAEGDGFIFFQADMPLLDPETVKAVLDLAGKGLIALPRHGGVPGNPVFFSARFKAELMAVEGDHGGRGVRDRHAENCRYVELASQSPMWDVDTKEKYEALLKGEIA